MKKTDWISAICYDPVYVGVYQLAIEKDDEAEVTWCKWHGDHWGWSYSSRELAKHDDPQHISEYNHIAWRGVIA